MTNCDGEMLSDNSSRVSEGQLGEQQFGELEEIDLNDDQEVMASVVRYEPCSEVFEVTIQDESSLTGCRPHTRGPCV